MNKLIIIYSLVLVIITPYLVQATGNAGDYYLRADLGYGKSKHKAYVIDSVTSQSLGITNKEGTGNLITLGIGKYATNKFRYELQFYNDDGFKTKRSNIKAKEKSMGVFLNFFYDYRSSSKFIPYVMGGIGYLRNKYFINDTLGDDIKFKKKASFAFQIGLGMAYQINSDLDLDFGIRLLQKRRSQRSSAYTSSQNHAATAVAKKERVTLLLGGVRFSF